MAEARSGILHAKALLLWRRRRARARTCFESRRACSPRLSSLDQVCGGSLSISGRDLDVENAERVPAEGRRGSGSPSWLGTVAAPALGGRRRLGAGVLPQSSCALRCTAFRESFWVPAHPLRGGRPACCTAPASKSCAAARFYECMLLTRKEPAQNSVSHALSLFQVTAPVTPPPSPLNEVKALPRPPWIPQRAVGASKAFDARARAREGARLGTEPLVVRFILPNPRRPGESLQLTSRAAHQVRRDALWHADAMCGPRARPCRAEGCGA